MKIEKLFKNIRITSTSYYFVFKYGSKPKLYIYLLSLSSIPFMIIGGKRAKRLYETISKSLKEFLDIEEISVNDVRYLSTTPDIGEIVLVWILSQLTIKNPDKELLIMALRFGVPGSVKALKNDLYKMVQSVSLIKNEAKGPLISTKIAEKFASSFRKILNELIAI